MFTRRQVVAAFGITLVARVTALAQQKNVRRIGFLSQDTAASDAGKQALEKFPAALMKLGYAIDRDIVIDWRWADGKSADLPRLAADLVRDKVDVIVARTNDPIRAAKAATRTIPIVMLNGNLPVEVGLIKSFAQPGENITGTAYVSAEMFAKQMQLLKELVPHTRRVAALTAIPGAGDDVWAIMRSTLSGAAERLGMAVQYFELARPEDVTPVLVKLASSAPDAVWYSGAPVLRARTEEIMAFLARHKLPSIASIPVFAEQGGLVHYAPEVDEFYERTAEYVDRILKGARPGELPVHQPTRYELVINLKTAKAIGIVIPPGILARATRTIEE
jgi:putative ABC transport system substrate-binding protein